MQRHVAQEGLPDCQVYRGRLIRIALLDDALHPLIVGAQPVASDLCKQIFGKGGETVWMQPPFYCDYGSNIELGERVFFNFNCVVLDVCRVRIGDYTLFGPAVQILTSMHPLDAILRRKQEYGKPIHIGSDVWIGAGALILPGVTIGSGTVIGLEA